MFKPGKLPLEFLEYLIKKYVRMDRRIIVGPGTGRDAAVIDLGSKYLVAKTDPVTLANRQAGWYLVNINANDIACMGAKPGWLIATLLLPESKTTGKMVEELFATISSACRKLDIALCGGHAEITRGIDRPLLVGAMFGEVEKERLVRGNACPGDDIILTKGIAIEGTAIIANEKEKYIRKKFSPSFVKRAKSFLENPGISIVKEALLANSTGAIKYMHDPTEGGLATGLYETARACNSGLIIEEEKIPVYPESSILCNTFGLDIMGTLASGALIIVSSPGNTQKILAALLKKKIPAAVVGKITDKKFGMKLKDRGGRLHKLKYFLRDEIIKIYGK